MCVCAIYIQFTKTRLSEKRLWLAWLVRFACLQNSILGNLERKFSFTIYISILVCLSAQILIVHIKSMDTHKMSWQNTDAFINS